MPQVLVVDEQKCTGCELCVLYCSFEKTQTFGRARSRVYIVTEEEKGVCLPSVCLQCEEPVCALVCPVDALNRDNKTGIVNKDEELCIKGCTLCIKACPFGAIELDPVTNKMMKCDLCGGNPVCARVCPTEAIQYLEAEQPGLSRKRRGMKTLTFMRYALAKTEGGGQK